MCQLLFPLHLLPSRMSQVSPLPVWICLLGLTAQAQSWDCPSLLLQGFVFLKFLVCALFSFGLICINYTCQWGPVWCFGTYIQHTSSKPACLHPSFPSTHPGSLGSTLPLWLFESFHVWERRCGPCVSRLGLFHVAARLPVPATVSKEVILYGYVIFNYIYTLHIPYLFTICWAVKLIPQLSYCKKVLHRRPGTCCKFLSFGYVTREITGLQNFRNAETKYISASSVQDFIFFYIITSICFSNLWLKPL